MGLTVEIVRSVFSKNRSVSAQDNNARRQYGEIKQLGRSDIIKETETRSEESLGTSIEVQTGGSTENQIQEQCMSLTHKMQNKARTQISRLKEDWDDSTVSSNISKLRIQNRLEATTRRERALAYAFSQQLRTCMKKKPTRSDSTEPNLGWSWLERWMATRLPENSSVDDRLSKCLDPISCDRRSMIMKKMFDVSGEEKESCASNDISVAFDSLSITAKNSDDGYRPVKNRLKAARSVSRRKTVPSYQYSAHSTKESKREAENEKKHKQMQPQAIGEIKCKDVSSQAPSDH
ncbi:protein IQ-DOMAIN 33 isoform X2 [Magnolia sinica]|uniref:protein IQ-DOMAIN 33 isoform X2 n=1 Tax=Magnolia sinica TaxID=86752 RepID=UPI0026588FCD|nr:protein IQ-DOMAIN 33 isoform X2 [Magnolia sinica]